MTRREDDRFRIRPGPPRSRPGPRSQRFVSQVLKEISKTGARRAATTGTRPASTFGRGRVAAGALARHPGVDARRVIIKSRFVVLKHAGAKSVATHLRYIEREGVTRDDQRGQAYSANTDAADPAAFEARSHGDRHQFRFIVSVEDAGELEDLRGYTRELMHRMEIDLESRLDWVAVDHWDTDNPHTHIVLRGRIGHGGQQRDLVIAPDYMAHGMRMRAGEIATEWLGPRTELEIHQSLLREVEHERLTSLDRALRRQATVDVVDLTEAPGRPQRQTMLRARLQRLEAMALAERIDANRWRLAPGMEQTLSALGERGDILRTMHRALKGERRELVTEGATTGPVVGRIAAKGLADELQDRGFLVIDGIDGRAHYVKLPAGADLAQWPVGGIIEAAPPGQPRALDRSIADATQDGLYTTTGHLAQLRRAGARDLDTRLQASMRRLEALRRAGIVQRVTDGVWQVPPDLMQRARQHDAQRAAGTVVELRARLPIEQQVRAIGATWLDRQLLGGETALATQGFGAAAREVMHRRVDFLVEHGLAERHGRRVVLVRNLLATLRNRELASVGKTLENQTGRRYRPVVDGDRVDGIYRGSLQLASGRFAMLDDGMGFSLVPWRPVVERRLGRHVSAVVRGSSPSWELRQRRSIVL